MGGGGGGEACMGMRLGNAWWLTCIAYEEVGDLLTLTCSLPCYFYYKLTWVANSYTSKTVYRTEIHFGYSCCSRV